MRVKDLAARFPQAPPTMWQAMESVCADDDGHAVFQELPAQNWFYALLFSDRGAYAAEARVDRVTCHMVPWRAVQGVAVTINEQNVQLTVSAGESVIILESALALGGPEPFWAAVRFAAERTRKTS